VTAIGCVFMRGFMFGMNAVTRGVTSVSGMEHLSVWRESGVRTTGFLFGELAANRLRCPKNRSIRGSGLIPGGGCAADSPCINSGAANTPHAIKIREYISAPAYMLTNSQPVSRGITSCQNAKRNPNCT
jgi:hypothetical protein